MRANRFTVMTLAVLVMTGCFMKKMGGVYTSGLAKTYGRLLPSLPHGSARMDQAAAQLAAVAPVIQASHQTAPPEQVAMRDDVPPPDEQPAARHHDAPAPDIQYTRVEAPRYPSSPFIAMYPASRGSSQHVCKQFQQSATNENDCMVECRAQMTTGPGSCSCMEMERCPDGVRVVR